MSSPATIYDVARLAGVSISTVSNVINRPDRVADSTRRKVLVAADELSYIPKADAANNARKHAMRIAVIAPFTSYDSFLERLKGVLSEATPRGIEVAVFDHESAATAAFPLINSLPFRGHFDGVMVMGTRLEPEVEQRLKSMGLPVVVVDAESDLFPSILCDDKAGGARSADYLYSLGHRSFAYIAEAQASEYESQSVRRLAGFQSRLDELGGCSLRVIAAGTAGQSLESALSELLQANSRPTALMAHYDALAIDAIGVARGLGIDVPSELSVMGCDDGVAASAVGLTTLHQPLYESGALATRALMSSLSGPALRSVVYLEQTVVARKTTSRLADTTSSLHETSSLHDQSASRA